jgi:hypothetical protein
VITVAVAETLAALVRTEVDLVVAVTAVAVAHLELADLAVAVVAADAN